MLVLTFYIQNLIQESQNIFEYVWFEYDRSTLSAGSQNPSPWKVGARLINKMVLLMPWRLNINDYGIDLDNWKYSSFSTTRIFFKIVFRLGYWIAIVQVMTNTLNDCCII